MRNTDRIRADHYANLLERVAEYAKEKRDKDLFDMVKWDVLFEHMHKLQEELENYKEVREQITRVGVNSLWGGL